MGKKTKVPTKVAKAAERKIDPALMPPPPPPPEEEVRIYATILSHGYCYVPEVL